MPKRTAPIIAVGVLNAIMGIYLLTAAALGLYIISNSAQLDAELARLSAETAAAGVSAQELPSFTESSTPLRFMSMFALIAGPVLIVTSIGVLRLAPWGRVLALLVAWVGLVLTPLAAAESWMRTGDVHFDIFGVFFWMLALTVMHSADARARFAPRPRALADAACAANLAVAT